MYVHIVGRWIHYVPGVFFFAYFQIICSCLPPLILPVWPRFYYNDALYCKTLFNSFLKTMDQPDPKPLRYRIHASTGGRVRIKFAGG